MIAADADEIIQRDAMPASAAGWGRRRDFIRSWVFVMDLGCRGRDPPNRFNREAISHRQTRQGIFKTASPRHRQETGDPVGARLPPAPNVGEEPPRCPRACLCVPSVKPPGMARVGHEPDLFSPAISLSEIRWR